MHNIIIATAVLILISAAGESIFPQGMEVYKAKTIKVDSAKSIRVKQSKQVEVHKANSIEVYKAKETELYKGKQAENVKGNLPAVTKANDVIEEKGKPDVKKKEVPAENKDKNNEIENLIGTWHTKIPGAVWETPNGRDGYNTLHVSAGLKAGDLVIKKDGTYKWNAYGGKSGKWVKGDSEYPLVLIDNKEKKNWKVGYDSKHTGGRDIIIWDGNYYWYDGKK